MQAKRTCALASDASAPSGSLMADFTWAMLVALITVMFLMQGSSRAALSFAKWRSTFESPTKCNLIDITLI